MFFKEKICLIFVLAILLGYNAVASARSSHDVAIRIAEICRYRVENKAVVVNGDGLVQAVDVVILSNSDRKWRFVAIPFENYTGMEWSTDNRVWHGFEPEAGGTMILTGSRSDWQSYRFYFKVNGISNKTISLGYQLLFNE